MLKLLHNLLMTGGQQRGQNQAELDASYEEFLRKYEHDTGRALKAILPFLSSQTTLTEPNQALKEILGAAAGAGTSMATRAAMGG